MNAAQRCIWQRALCVVLAVLANLGMFGAGLRAPQEAAAAPVLTEFPAAVPFHPRSIVAGPDGNLWFTGATAISAGWWHALAMVAPTTALPGLPSTGGGGGAPPAPRTASFLLPLLIVLLLTIVSPGRQRPWRWTRTRRGHCWPAGGGTCTSGTGPHGQHGKG